MLEAINVKIKKVKLYLLFSFKNLNEYKNIEHAKKFLIWTLSIINGNIRNKSNVIFEFAENFVIDFDNKKMLKAPIISLNCSKDRLNVIAKQLLRYHPGDENKEYLFRRVSFLTLL